MSPAASRRLWLGLGGASGACAVGFGAYSAHRLSGHAQELVSLASLFQLLHAGTLVALAALSPFGGRWLTAAGCLFVAGTAGFSGGLYVDALLDAPTPLIPLGGTCLILGWLALLAGALLAKPT